jgi:uncharacterized small protein (DUF1192 family)
VIDLAWYNEAAVQATTFSGLEIDWEGSLGSDHAMMHVTGQTRMEAPASNGSEDLGFLLDPTRRERWVEAFKARSTAHLFSQKPGVEEIEQAAAALTEDIRRTNREVLKKRRPPHPRASPWWNGACATAVQVLRAAQDKDERKAAQARLKGVIRSAKRDWADEYIENAQLWEVAAWRHGRRCPKSRP